ncbi:A24 family peptidase [Antrihabitans sp. YC2-6]|uniref:prepilin peptidase n=1 Tax=Antrihabitans sp. YC2-6 TaxID=2799498 RepID=UPI0018F51007|nr:A24 family peptidase [Antrihabitans sp. YC2-6]MBJ8345290.1 prepilin peptidase [Antrihabitans sp. YC2-6]
MSWLAMALFTLWCGLLVYFDVTRLKLPNVLTLSGAALVCGFGFADGRGTVVVIGGVLLAAIYLLVHLAAPTAMGAGDVKLALSLGGVAALGGPDVWLWAAILAPLGTATAGVVLLARNRRVGRTVVPHGPFMCGATLLALVVS